jgi:hypothetical protein
MGGAGNRGGLHASGSKWKRLESSGRSREKFRKRTDPSLRFIKKISIVEPGVLIFCSLRFLEALLDQVCDFELA